uniref:uncharacterized protein LOC120330364 n=1 Tax=Styela clava TaxID=7725 RepID=UPI00193A243C|nr:uncharacterized protein LOC120330364 [Styela clava]
MEQIQDQTCPICSENKDDLRILPCWHLACMNCILNMSQCGEGRAVKCHECRQTSLFENIRCLPKPLRCGCCNQFLKNSKVMPCCSKLYCIDCITKQSTGTGAWLVCPGGCSYHFYSVDELPKSKLCSLCFRLHSDDASLCDHSICIECNQKLQKNERGCPLCLAVRNPAPTPTNPIHPSQNRINITMEELENLNYQPQQNRTEFLNALQALSLIHQLNRSENNVESIQERQAARTRKIIQDDLPKAFLVLTCVFVAGYFYGMNIMLWIILGASMLITRPHLESAVFICQILNTGLWIINLYTNFYQVIIFTLVQIAFGLLLEIMYRVAFNGRDFYRQTIHLWICSAFSLAIPWAFFPDLFVHVVLSACLVMFLTKYLKYRKRENMS